MRSLSDSSADWSLVETHLNGIVVGATAFVCNFAVAMVFVILDGVDTVYELGGGEAAEIPVWKLGGFLLYGAHDAKLAGVVYRNGVVLDSYSGTTLAGGTGIEGVGTTVPALVYFAVPVVVLLAAGYHVAGQVGAPGALRSAVAGTSVVGGYAPLGVLGLVLFRYSETVSVAGDSLTLLLEHEGFRGLALVALLYPLVLGAVGGAVGGITAGE